MAYKIVEEVQFLKVIESYSLLITACGRNIYFYSWIFPYLTALKASMAFTVATSVRQKHWAVAAPHLPCSVPVRDTYCAIYLSSIYAAKSTHLNKK